MYNRLIEAHRTETSGTRLRISRSRVTRALLAVVAGLSLLNLLVQIVAHPLGHPQQLHVGPLFDVDVEQSIPTFFSTLLLVACTVAFALIALQRRQHGDASARHWVALSALLGVAALDESAGLHEALSGFNGSLATQWDVVRDYFWLVGLAVAAVALAFAFRRFIARLEQPIRNGILLGAGLVLVGGIGVEGVEMVLREEYGEGFSLELAKAFQELMEMLGAVVLLDTGLRLLAAHPAPVTVDIGS